MDGKQIDQFDGLSESSYGSFNPNLEQNRSNLSEADQKKQANSIRPGTSMTNLKKGRKIGDYSDFILAHQQMPAESGGLKPVQTHLALDKAVYEPLIITSA